ncbi:MAG: DUF1573 domain-containing protein [Phycisphaerae bacterium]|nr:DUF1573 domain-containing protein [Phycisphaerae bacterium]
MKHRHLVILILCTAGVIALVVSSQIFGLLGTKKPRIVFDATAIDFGEKEEGEDAVCTFSFSNKGNETLILKATKTSCKCLVTKPSKVEILEGESGELAATYDTLNANGDVKSNVLLFTNDPKAKIVKLTITGTIKKPYVYQPHSLDFGEAGAEEFKERNIVITKLTKREMEVTDVETSKPWLRASLVGRDAGNLQGGLSTGNNQLAVRIGADAPIGPIKEEVLVSLLIMDSSKPIRQIKIPVKGYVQGDLTYEPKTVFWGTVAQGQVKGATITVKSNAGKPVDVKAVKSNKELVKIVGVDVGQTSVCIRMELKKNMDKDFVSDVLIISTGSNTMPQIKVPVYAMITTAKRQDPSQETVIQSYQEGR